MGRVCRFSWLCPPPASSPTKTSSTWPSPCATGPVYGSLVRITLKPVSSNGFDYSVACFTRVRDLAGEELAAVKSYAEGFRKMVKDMLEQRAQDQAKAANIVQVEGGPVDLPDNDDHFTVGTLDGERELLPA